MYDTNEAKRGVIQNRARKQQIMNFGGLLFDRITPTDFDGFVDFGDRLFVIFEGKYLATEVPRGQMLALERVCDASNSPPNRYAVAIIAEHAEPVDKDIEAAEMRVRAYRFMGQWRKPMQRGMTLSQAIDRVVAFVENKQGRKLYRRLA